MLRRAVSMDNPLTPPTHRPPYTQSLPFPQMAMPEVAPLLRAGGHLISLVCKQLLGFEDEKVRGLEDGNGPGINSGRVLEDMIGDALKAKVGLFILFLFLFLFC